MGRKKLDLIGMRFGSLAVVSFAEVKGEHSVWSCKCDCGNITEVYSQHLKCGTTKSCGCRKGNIRHNGVKLPEYRIWKDTVKRCTNPNADNYERYGGRGIDVCARWRDFANFYADMGSRPSPHHSIDRIDNNNGYSKDNCKWATRSEQGHNKRIYKGNNTGVSGVTIRDGKYRCSISVQGKRIAIGTFVSLEDARIARRNAELKYLGKTSIQQEHS